MVLRGSKSVSFENEEYLVVGSKVRIHDVHFMKFEESRF
jgi:hypothetical protein